jgi:hypothetical protein
MSCGCMNRREFLTTTSLGLGGALTLGASNLYSNPDTWEWDPDKPMGTYGKQITVLPVLRHRIESYKEKTSWRNWGGVHTEQSAQEEVQRITKELSMLKRKINFPVKILPVVRATSHEEARKYRDMNNVDVMILYAAGAGYDEGLDPALSDKRYNIIFTRHRSGPVYDFYENAHNRFLRIPGDNFSYDKFRNYAGINWDDIVVDDYDEILWRLSAFYGLKNFIGKRIVALGGAAGKGCAKAPEQNKKVFNLDIQTVSYDDLAVRIKKAQSDKKLIAKTNKWAKQYLSILNTKKNTKTEFIERAFLLYGIFKDYLKEYDTDALTINACMGTILNVSETTACLPLSLMNDEGLIALCESDFNVIPAGILLHYVSGKPVFMNNPTYPHKGLTTCAHCTAPRRMDGKNYEYAEITTHYESDYGAAPKVEMPIGQEITLICPNCEQSHWMGFKGTVDANPYMPICRTQQDINIQGDWKKLTKEYGGSHWMMAYGDHLDAVGYAIKKAGLKWTNVSGDNLISNA